MAKRISNMSQLTAALMPTMESMVDKDDSHKLINRGT
jgi:hypothetical protein